MSQTALADTERADVMEGRERGQAPSLQPPPTGLTRLDPCDRCNPITTQYDKIKEYRFHPFVFHEYGAAAPDLLAQSLRFDKRRIPLAQRKNGRGIAHRQKFPVSLD